MLDIARLLNIVNNPGRSKADKQQALNQIRMREAQDGRTYYGAYNGGPRNPSELQRLLEEGEDK